MGEEKLYYPHRMDHVCRQVADLHAGYSDNRGIRGLPSLLGGDP